MRTDVLKLVGDAGALTHVIVLTYNIDFRFVQYLLRPILRRCGHPSLLIFADARRAAESFARGGALLSGLGVRYRVVPVAMPGGAAFHPKAVLLSGSERGTLLVGSGNLSFGGWRENGEIWLRRDTDRHGTAALASFREYLRRVVDRVPLRDAIASEIEAAFDGASRAWARELQPPGGLVGRVGDGPSLLERMREQIGERTFAELAIAAPYFDDGAHAVAAFLAAFGPAPTKLLVPRKGHTLRESAAAALPPQVTLCSTAWAHPRDEEKPREAFLHAKFYALTSGARVHVFLGSANASRAALLSSGERGNAELLAHVELGAAEYRAQILDELAITVEPPEFAEPEETDDDEWSTRLQILAARLEGGVLRVAFQATAGLTVTACLLDAVEATDFVVHEHVVELRASGAPPRTVALRGVLEGATITSPPCWVDQEEALLTSSSARSLAAELQRSSRSATIDVDAWTNVLKVFCQHLQVLPPASVRAGTSDRDRATADLGFTSDDVFVDVELPLHRAPPVDIPGVHGRAALLHQLMLRWFCGHRGGVPHDDDAPDVATLADDDEADPSHPTPTPPSPPPRAEPSAADKRRFDRLVTRLRESMADPGFLERRPPVTLAADLCLAAILLRTGLQEQWIDADRFFSVTHDIWRALFLSTPDATGSGWIELRHANASDRAGFRRALGTEQVAAALAAWALTDLPRASADPRHARFVLAALLSVARNEWLWTGGDLRIVASELATYVQATGEDRDRLAQAWHSLIRRGRALGRLERLLRTRPLREWRARVTQKQLARGELLWQENAGWCIATEACRRVEGANVPVLKLQGEDAPKNFRATLTVPVRDLATDDLAPLVAEIAADFA